MYKINRCVWCFFFSSMSLVMEQLQIEDSTKSMSTNHQSYNGQALESGSGAGQGVPVKHGEEM